MPSRLLRGRRYGGGVVIYDQPPPVTTPVDKAESRRDVDWLAVPDGDAQEGIGPAIYGCVAVDAHPLLPNDTFVFWRKRWQRLEVVSYGRRAVANRRRHRPPQDRLGVIQHHHALWI